MNRIYIAVFLSVSMVFASQGDEPNPFIGRQGVAVDSTEWQGKYTKVIAVAYDFTQEQSDLVVVAKKLHRGVFSISEPLSKEQIETVFSSITGKHTPWKSVVCFEPHHGLVFYDEDEAIVGSISLCFSCKRFRMDPSGQVSAKWDWESLRNLFEDLKVPFLENYTQAYEQHQTGKKPGPPR